MKKVSVIIPTYNSWNTLKNCIASIQNQTLKPREVFVVNNGSTDGTYENVKKKFPEIKLINLKTNTGVTGGRNTGIKEAKLTANYLFFFDHDMVAEKNMLSELVKVAESNSKIGIVTPKIYYWGKKKRIWSAGTAINLWTGKILFRGGEDKGQYEEVEEVQVAPAALLVKREVLGKIHFFDDCYFATYEDTDFCFRAREKGYKTYYAPQALAYHMLSWDPKDDVDRVLSRAYWVGRNRVIFMRRFGKNFIVFSFFLILFCIYYFLLSFSSNRIIDGMKFLRGTYDGLWVKSNV
ncbi:glycosyltransferase family 2 protein [Patescibacteria group bacterium]|nr:glycosyltransferase family 2 protein [Patescibacteria group bacterium]